MGYTLYRTNDYIVAFCFSDKQKKPPSYDNNRCRGQVKVDRLVTSANFYFRLGVL